MSVEYGAGPWCLSGKQLLDWTKNNMQLADFTELIRNMPVRYQAFTSKRSTWENHLAIPGAAGNALRGIFESDPETTISRSDLRNLSTLPVLDQFVMATLLWGYPRGMRGNHVADLIDDFAALTGMLSTAREQKDIEWDDHYVGVAAIRGVGLSTYTKFLSFLSVRIQGHEALILDDRIIEAVRKRAFEELEPLRGLSSYNAARATRRM